MKPFAITNTNKAGTLRVRWVPDELYQTVGSYAFETDEETEAAERWELERLADGRLVALGAYVEELCPTCGEWRVIDSLWGIVVEPETDALEEFAENNLDFLPTPRRKAR